jgi:hypothetical protein
VPVAEAAEALSDAPQVRQYRETGTLADEAAWCRDLADAAAISLPPKIRGRYTRRTAHDPGHPPMRQTTSGLPRSFWWLRTSTLISRLGSFALLSWSFGPESYLPACCRRPGRRG